MTETTKPDVTIWNEGTISLFTPRTPEAKKWISENVSADSQWFGNALVVEHRFVVDLALAMQEEGFVLRG